MRVPLALRPLVGKREILQSLRTRSPALARKLAYDLTSQTNALFQKMAYDPQNFNPNDPSTFPFSDADQDALRRYELEFGGFKIKVDGKEDHLMALGIVKEICKLPPEVIAAIAQAAPPPTPAQWVEPPPAHTITLGKAMTAYLPTLSNLKTRKEAERAIQQFIEHRGDVDIHTVQGVDVVNWNVSLPKTIKMRSADNAIQFLQGLLKWAVKNEYIHHATKLATEGEVQRPEKQAQRRFGRRGAVRCRTTGSDLRPRDLRSLP